MLLRCSSCGWVHMGRTLAEVTEEVARFNAYFATLDQAGKDSFGGTKSNVENYKHCFRCGADHGGMLPTDPDSVPIGSTIQAVLDPIWS